MPRERDKTDAPKRMPSKLRLQREHRLVLESSHRIAADIVSRVEETEIKNRGVVAMEQSEAREARTRSGQSES